MNMRQRRRRHCRPHADSLANLRRQMQDTHAIIAERAATMGTQVGHSFSGNLTEQEIFEQLVALQKRVRAGGRV